MATSFLSPGVYFREVDLSVYIPNLSTTAVGCVGYATKGPINEPQYITNPVQFSTVFGETNTDMMGPYAALQFLSMGRQLWYVRVAEPDDDPEGSGYVYSARPSAVTLQEATTKAKVTGTKTNIVTVKTSNDTLSFRVDGSKDPLSVTFTFPAGVTTLYKSMSDMVSLLNADANFHAYFDAYLSASGSLVIERNVAGSNHGFSVYGDAAPTFLGTSATVPTTAWGTGNVAEKAFVLSNKTYASFTAADPALNKVHFVLDGATVTVTLTDGVYETAAAFVAALNGNSTFNAHLIASVVADGVKVSIKPASAKLYLMLGTDATPSKDAGLTVFGNVNANKVITGSALSFASALTINSSNNELKFLVAECSALPLTYVAYTVTLTSGSYASLAALFAEVNARLAHAVKDSDGTEVDLSSLIVASAASTSLVLTYDGTAEYVVYDVTASAFSSLFGAQPSQKYASTTASDVLTFTATSHGTWGNNIAVNIQDVDNVNGTFTVVVYERGYVVEKYTLLSKAETLTVDGVTSDNPNFVETRINGVSSRVTVTNGTLSGATLLPSQNAVNSNTYLTGGLDGATTTINPSTFIGTADEVASTGLQLFRNPEQLDVNLLIAPGVSSAPVINAMVDICLFRRDCMCIADPPKGLLPSTVVDWVNGDSGAHAAFNTSFAALYWPWLQIYDPVNRTTVWTPPSGHIAYTYAFTDYNSETWFAPAGLNRGHLATPIKAEYIPSLGERDLLYQNNVNPIATFIRDGINVWGQKTLQRTPTALDRVNVRRLMLYLEKVVATAVRTLTFEPSDRMTWLQFVNLVQPFLESVQKRRGVMEYKVICDETTNTSDVIDRNEMRARIYVRPTKAAEFISIDFVVTDSGTAFSELVY